MTDNEKISHLTTGAIKTTMESAIDAMIKSVIAAEEKTREIREFAEQVIADFRENTATLTDSVASHVAACQAATDMFQELHLKILNPEAQVEVPKIITTEKPAGPQDLDELRELARQQKERARV